ncbi:hypothetical protein GCM10011400_18120 [Paraburkholderia caffeinilytica]|uniref:Uncharacterized protein n=1 Tax=Paraburkholderia caffeinilytica TaxID=1761016 RepID=A0ABQ1M5D6_9BURK|nr:hypothetical protein GCM10011400_18120 [Paraburkholderia caffeinilytica]
MDWRLLCIDGKRLSEELDALVYATRLQRERAQQLQRLEMAWLEFEDLTVELFGLGECAILLKRDGLPKHVVQLLREIGRLAHEVSFDRMRVESGNRFQAA